MSRNPQLQYPISYKNVVVSKLSANASIHINLSKNILLLWEAAANDEIKVAHDVIKVFNGGSGGLCPPEAEAFLVLECENMISPEKSIHSLP